MKSIRGCSCSSNKKRRGGRLLPSILMEMVGVVGCRRLRHTLVKRHHLN